MKITKKIVALLTVLLLTLSMVTVVSAAETKTVSMNGVSLFSITNVVNSFTETYEYEGEVFHEEIMQCEAPAVITMLNTIQYVDIMDHTYEIQNENELDTGFIMPDNCPGEKAFWEEGLYRENISAGTTYALSEPGTYGINLSFEDGTSYYACVQIAGERVKDAPNFTKAYYQQRQENAVDNTNQQSSSLLNSSLITCKNILKQDGTIKVENQNNGEIVSALVYSCLTPAVITAATELDSLQLWGVEEKQDTGIYYPYMPYDADNEIPEGFYARYEGTTPAGIMYTVTGSYEFYYLHASKGAEEINVILRVDGSAPVNIANGKRTENILFWSEIPNGSITINGVYDISYDEGEAVYVIDKDSTVTFNSYLSDYIHVYADGDEDSKPLLENSVCVPLVYNTISYTDNIWWYDEEGGETEVKTQVAPGMTVKFNKTGNHWIHFGPGYASKEERIAIQYDENTLYGWQYSPTVSFLVIDPAPVANYTASKVIVNGVETEFEAYNINDNNYFKLRDIAAVINGTEKQFAVFWDGEKNAISLLSNAPYTPVGGELAKGDGAAKQSVMTTSIVYKNEKPINLSAYNINGNNYFKLRDLGQAFDFDVSWDGINNCITIDTSSSYTAD